MQFTFIRASSWYTSDFALHLKRNVFGRFAWRACSKRPVGSSAFTRAISSAVLPSSSLSAVSSKKEMKRLPVAS